MHWHLTWAGAVWPGFGSMRPGWPCAGCELPSRMGEGMIWVLFEFLIKPGTAPGVAMCCSSRKPVPGVCLFLSSAEVPGLRSFSRRHQRVRWQDESDIVV